MLAYAIKRVNGSYWRHGRWGDLDFYGLWLSFNSALEILSKIHEYCVVVPVYNTMTTGFQEVTNCTVRYVLAREGRYVGGDSYSICGATLFDVVPPWHEVVWDISHAVCCVDGEAVGKVSENEVFIFKHLSKLGMNHVLRDQEN